MFSLFNKVTFDPVSGRPTPPIFWNLTGFYMVMAWLMAAIMFFCAGLAVRDGVPAWATALGFCGLFLVSFAHWRKRQIDREKVRFRAMLDAYEKGIQKAFSEV